MNRVIKRLQSMLNIFVKITTAVICVTAVYIQLFWGQDTDLTVNVLWQILTVSFLCTIGSSIFPCDGEQEISKRSMLLRTLFCFIFVNVVVLGCGFLFEWFYLSNLKMLLGMEAAIIIVFAAVSSADFYRQYKAAEQMNRRLRERE